VESPNSPSATTTGARSTPAAARPACPTRGWPVARKSMSNEEGEGWRLIFRDEEEREDQSELGLAGW